MCTKIATKINFFNFLEISIFAKSFLLKIFGPNAFCCTKICIENAIPKIENW